MSVVERVKKAAEELQALIQHADKMLAPRPDVTKQVPVEVSRALAFLTGDFNMKSASFVNGGDDIYLTRLGCEVRMTRPAPTSLDAALPYDDVMLPQQQGFYAFVGDVMSPSPMFDFAWNYQIASTNSSYNSPANGVGLLSRGSLGNSDSGEGLTFEQPGQLVRAGDTVTFFVQPTLSPIPGLDPSIRTYAATSFVVNLFAVGRRGGVMAEADYEIR